jgi:arylsulfatase A-like enzyme
MFPDGNYTLFILSDHGWPIGMHKGNIFNERGGFEENFLTSMVLVVGNHEELRGKKVEEKYSLMDVMPTIAELLEILLPKNDYCRSFAHVFSNEQKHEHKNNKTILVQPYSSKFLNIIDGNMKYQYNAKNDHLLAYNLSADPEERYPNILSQTSQKNICKISKLLPLF